MDLGLNIGISLAIVAFGFLMGSIPTGVIIGKLFFHDDPRNYGSHNPGGTNTGRAFGKKIGITVIILDMAKTIIAFWVPWAILRFTGIHEQLWDDGVFYNYLGLFFAAFGHCFSPWLKFKGGKAVSCFMASTGGLGWVNFITCAAIFFPLFKKRHVMSIATITTSVIVTIFQWLMFGVRELLILHTENGQRIMDYAMFDFGFGGGVFYGWQQALISTLVMVVLIARHASNIKRIKEGNEKPVEWK